jgi:hypothetical protein
MATYYLNADTGNDSTGTGTALLPWKTISKAHTSASSGDTIVCQDSTAHYTWANQTFSKALTIVGQQNDASGAIFDGAAGNIKWSIGANLTLSKLTFEDMTCGTSWPGLPFDITTSSVAVDVSQCKFKDMTIGGRNGFQQHGLFGGSTAVSGVTFKFERNLVLPTIQSSLAGLGFGGILFNFRSFTSSTFTIRNNTISIGEFSGDAEIDEVFNFASASGSTLDLRNNIIYSVENNAVSLVTNNTTLASYQFTNNCYYTTGSAYTNVPSTSTNNITSDPLFVDVANNNYNLRPTSPCIDTGVLI